MKPEKQLYQWDTNQSLVELTPSAQFVDYPIGDEVIRIKADGNRCRIPDEVLQTYGGKTCYERYPDGTYRAYSFSVLYAPKPPDYVYTPEERTTFEALTARVDAAIEEIKRRADSGEFTPKKGVDYFTDAEKAEMMEGVSSGAVGEFRKVVDSATTEYNANASEKLTTYNANAEQHTTDYNRNAAEKLEAYNQNHTEKVAEYNANAETKTAEFDTNAAALQTEVDRLRGECDTLAAENRKQENRIDALIKLNKGQTYDILPEEGETASRTAPSGAKYVSVDKVGGKSVVWNQLVDKNLIPSTRTEHGLTFTNNGDGSVTVNGTAESTTHFSFNPNITYFAGHKYLLLGCPSGGSKSTYRIRSVGGGLDDYGNGSINTAIEVWNTASLMLITVFSGAVVNNLVFKPQTFDLTQMFGSTIADYIYSLEQSQAGAGVAWFKQMFPADYYPYSEPTIISSQTDRVDISGANIWDDEVSKYQNNWTRNGNVYKSNRTDATYVYQDLKLDVGTYTLSAELISFDNDKMKIQFIDSSGTVLARKDSITDIGRHSVRYVISMKGIYRVLVGGMSTGSLEIANIMLTKSSDSEYKPYSLQQITTGFPVLNSAGSVYDYIDLNEGKLHQRVGKVDLGSLEWYAKDLSNNRRSFYSSSNICNKLNIKCDWGYATHQISILGLKSVKQAENNWGVNSFVANQGKGLIPEEKTIVIILSADAYADATSFKEAMNGVMLYYELAEEVITDIDIPTELSDWLTVEAGGSITFHNTDEGKRLLIPNKLSFVRKLDEVSV